jgi:hypothetical protein
MEWLQGLRSHSHQPIATPRSHADGSLSARSRRANETVYPEVVVSRDDGAWGVAYPRQTSQDDPLVQIAQPFSTHNHRASRVSRSSVGYGTVDPGTPGRVRPLSFMNELEEEEDDEGRVQVNFAGDLWRSKLRESLLGEAPSAQPGFRAIVAMVQMLVGSFCIQVGLKEEDRLCQATYTSLLIICGAMQLLQCGTSLYLIWHGIGLGGEEVRAVLFMGEVMCFISVLHELATASCENLKMEIMAVLYIVTCSLIWATTGILWLSWYKHREQTHLVQDIEDLSQEPLGGESSPQAEDAPVQIVFEVS